MSVDGDDFGELRGRELSAVVFVRDYLQLQFDPPPTLNIYTPVTVVSEERTEVHGEPGFANLLIGQIGKTVRDVVVRAGESFELGFSDGSRLCASLRPVDLVGGEAIYFSGTKSWSVL
jgi:hypothetical protein